MENYSIKQLKDDLRNPFAWPGGYEIVFIADDGEILCHNCVKSNFRIVLDSIMHDINDGWKIVDHAIEAVSADYTDNEYKSYCAHCNKEFGELS